VLLVARHRRPGAAFLLELELPLTRPLWQHSEQEPKYMDVIIRPLSDIRPYERNPRLNDEAVEAVMASLREFGFRQPIVVDTDSVIICGHTRFKAAQRLGLEQVPVHVATDLTPAQIKAYRIADNQTASLARWDPELLPIELSELDDLQFDLSPLGVGQREPDDRSVI